MPQVPWRWRAFPLWTDGYKEHSSVFASVCYNSGPSIPGLDFWGASDKHASITPDLLHPTHLSLLPSSNPPLSSSLTSSHTSTHLVTANDRLVSFYGARVSKRRRWTTVMSWLDETSEQ